MSAVSHSEDCPFLLPCWGDQLASIPLGMACKPKCRGKQQHNPKRRLLSLNPAARLQLFQSPSLREGRQTPTPYLSRTSMKDAGNCPCSTRHNIAWQPVVHPRASHLPPESPKEVPSAAYCLAEVLLCIRGAAACLKVPGHSTEQG